MKKQLWFPFFAILALNALLAFAEEPMHVTYGSALIFKHIATGYKLYSTNMFWGFGSGHQVVIGVPETPYRENLVWLVKPGHSATVSRQFTVLEPLDNSTGTPAAASEMNDSSLGAGSFVKCGAIIRLEHVRTESNLHSNIRQGAALFGENLEVCGYGKRGAGDQNDDFQVECISEGETFWFVNSPIRLIHVATGGQLGTAKAALFNQQNCSGCPINGNVEVSVQYAKNCRSRGMAAFPDWEAQAGLVVERHEEPSDSEKSGQTVKDEL